VRTESPDTPGYTLARIDPKILLSKTNARTRVFAFV
jgi:hypothetical protein